MNDLDISEGSSTRNLIDSFVESGAETFYDPQLLDLDIDYDVGSPSITEVTGEGFTLTVGGGPGTTSAIDSELGDFEYWAGYYVMKHNDENGYLSDEDAFDWVWWDGDWGDLWYNEDTERYECTFTIDGLDPETEYDVYTLIEVKDYDTYHSYVSVTKRVSTTTTAGVEIDYATGSPSTSDVTDSGLTLEIVGGDKTTAFIESITGDFSNYAGYYIVKHDSESGYLSDEDAFDAVWFDGAWDNLDYDEESGQYGIGFEIGELDPDTEYDIYTLIEIFDGENDEDYHVSVVKRVSFTTSEVEAELSPSPTDEAELSPSPTDEAELSPTPTDEAELSPTPTDEAEPSLIEAGEGAGSVEGEDGTTFEPGTEFIIEKVTADVSESDMEDYTAGVKLLVDGKEINEVYEIRLLLDGEPVQPDGSVTVRIKLTAEQKALGGLKIVYIDDLGVVTLIDSTVEGDYIVFTTDHFSTYGLLADSVSPNPETGDGGATATILLVLAAAGVLMFARRRSAGKAV